MKRKTFHPANEEARLADQSRLERLRSIHQNTKDPRALQLLEALEMTLGRPSGLQKSKFSNLKGQLRKAVDSYLESK